MSAQKKKLKVKKPKPTLQPLPDSGNYEDGNSKFARALASNDYQTRAKGLEALSRWLAHKDQVGDQDMLKIWKSLYYCFWHSDKAPVQEDLALTLSKLQLELKDEVAFTYFTAFVETLRREWFGIDRHRLDKFLLLVRHFLAHTLRRLRTRSWPQQAVQRYAQHIEHHVLLPSDTYRAVGLAFHLADIFLPELLKEAAEAPPPALALDSLLQPFAAAVCRCRAPAALSRYRESVFSALLDEVQSPSEAGPLRHLDVQALADSLFERGAAPDVVARNRDALYTTSKTLERAARKRARREGPDAAAPAAPPGGGRPQQPAREARGGLQQGQAPGAAGPAPTPAATAAADAPPGTEQPLSKKQRRAAAAAAEAASAAASPIPQQQAATTPSAAPGSTKKRGRGSSQPASDAANGTPSPTQPSPSFSTSQAGHTPANGHHEPAAAAPTTTATHKKKKKGAKLAFADTPQGTPSHSPAPAPSKHSPPSADPSPLPLSPVHPDNTSPPDGTSVGPPGHTPHAFAHQSSAAGPAGATPAALPTTRGKKLGAKSMFASPSPSPAPPLNIPASPAMDLDLADFQFHTPAAFGGVPETPTLIKSTTRSGVSKKSARKAAGEVLTPLNSNGTRSAAAGTRVPTTGKKKVIINLRRNQAFDKGTPPPQPTPVTSPKSILKHKSTLAAPATEPKAKSRPANGAAANGASKPVFLTPQGRAGGRKRQAPTVASATPGKRAGSNGMPWPTPDRRQYPRAASFFES